MSDFARCELCGRDGASRRAYDGAGNALWFHILCFELWLRRGSAR
jgi:hypothetical protein